MTSIAADIFARLNRENREVEILKLYADNAKMVLSIFSSRFEGLCQAIFLDKGDLQKLEQIFRCSTEAELLEALKILGFKKGVSGDPEAYPLII